MGLSDGTLDSLQMNEQNLFKLFAGADLMLVKSDN